MTFIRFMLITCGLAVSFSTASSQGVSIDMTLEDDFRAQVKSLDEFQERFNGNFSNQISTNDSINRRKNILNLFDFQMKKDKSEQNRFKELVSSFVDSVISNNVEFNIINSGLWAECKSIVKYKGQEKKITLIFQKELYKEGIARWALCGVKGLEKAGIINENFYSISPVENEIHFLGLQDLFNLNKERALGFRSKSSPIDQLTAFLILVREGKMQFNIVEEQIYHYLDVPGFAFSIKEVVRIGRNSGWLISSIIPLNHEEKITYINKLFGYE